MIKQGDVEYYELLSLRYHLKGCKLNELNLTTIDALRTEVEVKITLIDLVAEMESLCIKTKPNFPKGG